MRRGPFRLFAVGVTVVALAGPAPAEPMLAEIWGGRVTTELSALDLPPEILGEGWVRSPGFRIDDLADLDRLEGLERALGDSLAKKLGPLGVRGVGDYSLARDSSPTNIVSVRVYRFHSAEACRDWWRRKYRYEGWERHYEPVPFEGRVAVDSRQMNKRAVAFGDVWLTAHQLGEGDEHSKALEHVIARLGREPSGAYTSPP